MAGILLTYTLAPAQPALPVKVATAATAVPPAGAQPTSAVVPSAGAPPAEALLPKPPRKFLIDGKLRPLKPGEVRPYVAVTLEPEPVLEPTEVKVVEVDEDEAQVLARPWYGAPMLGTVALGARLPVRGVFSARSPKYCQSRRWLALAPAGWLCSKQAHPTKEAASTLPAMQVQQGERLPFKYVMVGSKDPLPMWASVDDRKEGAEPERQLQKGDSIAVLKTWRFDSETYYISAEGKVLPVQGTYAMSPSSQWKGVVVDDKTHLPFGWITPEKAKVYEAPGAKKPVDTLARRTRVDILEEAEFQKKRYLKIRLTQQPAAPAPAAALALGAQAIPAAAPAPAAPAPAATAVSTAAPPEAAAWVLASDVNEVRRKPPAEGINPVGAWIDVDLGEQVLVAYQGDQPVYATLVSSGRSVPTPMGNYPLWAKVSAITMKSQPYDDRAYFVNKVPWSLFFQAHNAIHGAYWHDRFGVSKSHGCVNVSPLDARHMFEWMQPELPPGWSSIRPLDLHQSVTVHIYNSQLKRPFRQERPIGPPDKDDEAERLDLAEKRRAEAAAAAEATSAPVAPVAAPPPGIAAPKP